MKTIEVCDINGISKTANKSESDMTNFDIESILELINDHTGTEVWDVTEDQYEAINEKFGIS